MSVGGAATMPDASEAPKPWERSWGAPIAEAPKPRTILDDAKDLPGQIWKGAKDLVTGEDRTEFPEMGEFNRGVMTEGRFDPKSLRYLAGQLVSGDPKQLADITVKTFPGTTQRQDKFGNPIITYEGKDYYANKPGLSEADAIKFAGDLVTFAPAGRAALWFGKVLAPVAAGGAFAATSVAQQKASQALGSNQPLDWEEAVKTGGFGAATQMLLGPAGRVVRRVFTKNELYNPQTQRLTPAGEETLRAHGIDPAIVTQDFAERFGKLARDAADPGQAARVAEAQSLPVPVKPTRGQVTMSPSDQMFESMAEKGAYGTPAETIMRGKTAMQRDAISGNVGAISDKIAGGQRTVVQPGDAGAATQARLDKMRETERKGVKAAYDEAGERVATVPYGEVQKFAFGVKSGIADFHPESAPKTWRIVDDIEKLTAEVPGATPGRPAGPPGQSKVVDAEGKPFETPGAPAVKATGEPRREVLLRELEMKRRQLSNLRGSSDATEAAAAGRAVKSYDDALADLFKRDVLSGDAEAINAWRKARDTNSAFASRFKGEDIIQSLTEREPRSGRMQLVVTPEEASNAIFGSARLFGRDGNLSRDLGRLREVLGPDSPEWKGIREEAWLRLARAGNGKVDPATGVPQFSGANFARAMDGVLSGGPQTAAMRTLFTEEELALMQQFKRVAARTTTKVDGGDNYSNTAVAASNILQKLMGTIFTGEGAAGRLMSLWGARAIYSMGAGMSATSRLSPSLATKSFPASFGAALTSQFADDDAPPRSR